MELNKEAISKLTKWVSRFGTHAASPTNCRIKDYG